ncbi:site-specific integrase [Roseateles oligotrophus]|uniref:Tyr recombinase domain-containing protein n=1 Tax=Roseateles oligotrophus TaxID=1769250 RepID=A0ABT2YCA0_9BURK|nr:hypothetical protein [Roseateles oligotrophus]MCV2367668.1 hypothetical protein [Roseateles oligotrophus]
MSGEGKEPQAGATSKARGLASCKSAEHDANAAVPAGHGEARRNACEASTALTQSNGHEEKATAISTLPVASWIRGRIQENITVTRPVMCAAPSFEGSRSESTSPETGPASDVTLVTPAVQGGTGGAAVAGPGEAEQAQPACITVADAGDANANEEDIENDGFGGELNRAAHFEVVRSARSLMREIAQSREKRKDTEPADGTTEKYRQLTKVLLKRAKQVPHGVNSMPSVCVALADYAAKGNSFYTMRSAAAWVVQGKVAQLLKQQDQLQRQPPSATKEWSNSVDSLNAAMQLLRSIQGLDLKSARHLSAAVAVAPKSKRLVLKKADESWREEYFRVTAQSSKYRHAALLQGLCGMRPLELERGVVVWRRGPTVAIKIQGAKVRETAGQPWRGVFIPAEKFPAWFLEDLGSQPKTYSAPSIAMRSYLKRLSPQVFPVQGDKPQLILSSYVLRHAIATDLRQEGWDSAEIAQVLGERCAATSRWYGLRWRGSKFRRIPQVAIERGTVQTARPVVRRESDFLAKKHDGKSVKKQSGKPRLGA